MKTYKMTRGTHEYGKYQGKNKFEAFVNMMILRGFSLKENQYKYEYRMWKLDYEEIK